jgi:hypothetical protein
MDRSSEDTEAALRRLDWFARWSDDVFRIPGTSVRIGLEPLVGLLPGVGDAAGLLVAAYVPIEAWRIGAPPALILRMLGNIAVDGLLGTVPLVGDAFDVVFKANRRNVQVLQDWLDDPPPDDASPLPPSRVRDERSQ